MLLLKGFLHFSGSLMHQEEQGQRTVASFNKQDLKSWLHINTKAIGLPACSELENKFKLQNRTENATLVGLAWFPKEIKLRQLISLCEHTSLPSNTALFCWFSRVSPR